VEHLKKSMYSDIRKILIVSGGTVDYDWAQDWLYNNKYDYIIAADSGLQHCDKMHLSVDYLVGDYDSVNHELLEQYEKTTETKTYPPEKDYTDTHIALKKAIEMKPEYIDIIGATGNRIDHMMTNISIMREAAEAGIFCAIFDTNNKIYQICSTHTIQKCKQYGKYISLIPMTPELQLTLKGMKYPLKHQKIYQGESICQSNEIIEQQAQIMIESGRAIVIEARD